MTIGVGPKSGPGSNRFGRDFVLETDEGLRRTAPIDRTRKD